MNDRGDRIEKDMQDVQDRQEDYLPHFGLTNDVLGCCFAVINYLTVAQVPVGLLVNFGRRKLEYKRLHHQEISFSKSEADIVPF